MNNNIMPPITKNLIIINVLMYFAQVVAQRYGVDLPAILGLHFFIASDFSLYQLFTYMFLHGSLTHLFFNMFALWMFGRIMEQVWGQKRFIFFYLACGIGAGLFQEISQGINYWMIEGLYAYETVQSQSGLMSMNDYLNLWTTIGASGACYGILLGFGLTFPEERILLLIPPIPIKAKFFVFGYAILELFFALSSPGDQIAHFAHLGGMFIGYLILRYWRHKDRKKHTSSFTGWETWKGSSPKKNIWERIKEKFPRKKDHIQTPQFGSRGSDYEYNSRKKEEEKEINQILEKIKKSGYDSLTEKEKKKLFDSSKR